MGDYGGYDPDAELDAEEEERTEAPEALKEQLIFLIDCQPNMLRKVQYEGELVSYLQLALRLTQQVLEAKVIQSPGDQIAVLAYNVREKLNASEFEGVHVLQELAPPDAHRIVELGELTDEAFEERIGAVQPSETGPTQGLTYAFWTAKQLFGGANAIRTLVVFTNDENPPGSGVLARQHREPVLRRAEELAVLGCRLRLFPLIALTQPFDHKVFWQRLVTLLGRNTQRSGTSAGAASTEPSSQQQGGDGGSSASSVPTAPGGGGVEAAGSGSGEGLDEDDLEVLSQPLCPGEAPEARVRRLYAAFNTSARHKLARKRAAFSMRWTLAPSMIVSLQGYKLVMEHSKGYRAATMVRATDNAPLVCTSTYIATDTGAMLQAPTKRSFKLDTKTGGERFPMVVVDKSETAQVRAPLPPGLTLLGFKPRACLKDWHQIASSTFLRPYDGDIKGSTLTFMALHQAMLRDDRIAICSFVRTKSSIPSLVALVAQVEVKDTLSGAQLEPPGMQLIVLPWMDDIRAPEQDIMVGVPDKATDEQVAVAEALIDALDLEAHNGGYWSSADVRNPAILRHYNVLQALALGRPVPPVEELQDDTCPDKELFGKQDVQDCLMAFREVLALGAPSTSGKRKAGGSEGGAAATKQAKAEAAGEAYGKIPWEDLIRSGKLATLKNDELKIYLHKHKLPLSGNKADLIARIQNHHSGGV